MSLPSNLGIVMYYRCSNGQFIGDQPILKYNLFWLGIAILKYHVKFTEHSCAYIFGSKAQCILQGLFPGKCPSDYSSKYSVVVIFKLHSNTTWRRRRKLLP